jgi:hypothetical protein
VVPPLDAKRVSADAPVPDDVPVVLVVGTKTASREQGFEITFEYGLLVDPTGPVLSAYTKHKNFQPVEAVAAN